MVAALALSPSAALTAATGGTTVLVIGDGGTATRELASRFDGVDIDVVDVWQSGSVAVDHDVVSLPTAIVLRGGVEDARLVGPSSHRQIDHFVDRMQLAS